MRINTFLDEFSKNHLGHFSVKYCTAPWLIILALSILTVPDQAIGQNLVSGLITDEKDEPLIGATVQIEGTSQGTITDIDGNFSLSLPNIEELLIISYVGYIPQEIRAAQGSVIKLSLKLDVSQLEEVIVVGYGSQRKRDITGAINVVDTEELDKSRSTNLTDQLQGRAPGVQVTANGEPGVIGTISIRGNSFFGNNNPLFVIDGILTNDSPNLNPKDIASIQILKDASSAAIYGSRAANGVIVITTNKGERGKPTISLSSNLSFQSIPKRIELMNAQQWAAVSNAASDISGIAREAHAVNPPAGVDTDWQEEVFRDNAPLRDHFFSIRAGGAKNKVYFSLGNVAQEGTLDGLRFERLSTRLNAEFEIMKGLTIGQNLSIGTRKNNLSPVISTEELTVGEESLFLDAITMLPVIPVLDPSKTSGYGHGVPGVAATFSPNPVGVLDIAKNQFNSTKILGNLFANWEIMEGLEYRFSAGIDGGLTRIKQTWLGGQIRMTTPHPSGLTEQRFTGRETFFENRLTYSKNIGDHQFTAMTSYNEQDVNITSQRTAIQGGFEGNDPLFQISATTASPNQIQSQGRNDLTAIRSLLGRLTYNYKDKYLITANIRQDGSSKFSAANRWGIFPAISVGWTLSKEPFFKVPAIDYFKIRAGYGEVGNASIDDFAFQQGIRSASIGGVNYNLGPSSKSVVGATAGDIVNENIRWEVLKETNIGVDLTLFNGQLEFIGDYYFGQLEDLLAKVPIPASAGFSGQPTVNAVTMDRFGWEFSLSYRKLTGDFQYAFTGNIFQNNNEVRSLPFGVNEFPGFYSTSRIGLPLGQLFLPVYEGIYTQADIDALSPDFTVEGEFPKAGDAKYKDLTGRDENGQLTGVPDGNINFDDDRALIGNPIPKLQYGFNINLSYKNIDATIFFQGLSGRNVFNNLQHFLRTEFGHNYPTDLDPYNLTGSGTEPNIERGGFENGNAWPSSRFVESGDFFRLKNLQIGYTIPWNKVSQLRAYITGQNLLTFTNYTGLDPEFNNEEDNVFAPGVDPVAYPNARILGLGFDLVF